MKKYWKRNENAMSNKERKELIAEALAILCRVVMNNHVYKFAGKIMLQEGKGCIGDEAIGFIALLVMRWWSIKFKEKLAEATIENKLLKIYVDDTNGVFQTIRAGIQFKDGKLEYNENKKLEDENVPDDERTMEVIKDIANSVDPMIKMTIDFPSKHEDKKVPMLDVKVWLEEKSNNNIFYQFYEKPTKNRFVISKTSAMPMSKKIDTLSQGIFRRMHNTKKELDWELKASILEKYMAEIKASGYSERDRHEILRSGMKRYENLREKGKKGERPFYRQRNFKKQERRQEKENKKVNWFKQKNNKFTTVYFVPPTPGSKLLKMLKTTEEAFQIDENNRIKFVETCGRKYVDYF